MRQVLYLHKRILDGTSKQESKRGGGTTCDHDIGKRLKNGQELVQAVIFQAHSDSAQCMTC